MRASLPYPFSTDVLCEVMHPHANRPAVGTVLGIAELLQAILLHLDIQTLLLEQRVNHDFHNVTKSDLLLRQNCFPPQVPTMKLIAGRKRWI